MYREKHMKNCTSLTCFFSNGYHDNQMLDHFRTPRFSGCHGDINLLECRDLIWSLNFAWSIVPVEN